jgi:DNA-binding CsgD family transcriptional regulator
MPTRFSPDITKLGGDMLEFASTVDTLDTPNEVLDRLHQVTAQVCKLNVLAGVLLPVRCGDWRSLEKGKTVFLHKSAPEGWWEEWHELTRKHPPPTFMLAQLSLAPFTQSELLQRLEPLGIDRWPTELALKYGMRDGLTCPIGGRWVIAFWSPTVISQRIAAEARAILLMGATFAAFRLQKLIGLQPARLGNGTTLTPRELAVLRLLSLGNPTGETASLLKLGEETVRSHLKKAQLKLGVRGRTHAVAQAIRLHLIP